MADTMPDPSQLYTRSVQPTGEYNQAPVRPDTAVGDALQGLGKAGTQLVDSISYYQRMKAEDDKRLENFNLEKSFSDFTTASQQGLMTSAQNIQEGGADFTKNATETFDQASSKWLSTVPQNLQPEWQARMAKFRGQFSTSALGTELKERDSYYKNTVATQLNRFGNGIGQNPAAFDNYVKMGNDFIDASGMAPADKDVRKKLWAGDSAEVLANTLIVKDPGGFKKSIAAGDPRFQDLDAEKVRSLVGAADREQRQRALEAKQAANLDRENFTNGLLLNIYDGKAGQADIDNARKNGQLKDASDVFRAENVLKQREAEVGSVDFVNRAMAIPNFPFNPYDPVQQKGVNSAVKAMGGSPGAAFNIWQKTGILGETGGVALRGALVSTDPQRVGAAANIASNMMAHNPNAFAGVDGRADIEKSAMLFSHYTDDLGYDAATASQKVAQANDPAYQSKIKISDQDVAAFRKTLKAQTPVGALVKDKNTFFGMFGGNVSASTVPGAMKSAIATDFAELASDYYQKTGDPAAAQSYAQKKINGLYGVSNGQIMKYPPEKTYPAMGEKPSTSYVYDQAAADVKSITGHDVARKDIVLTPLPTATAEAWRNNQRVPYQLHYYQDVGGQRVLQTVPGRAFVADPAAAAKAITEDRKSKFENERTMHQELEKDFPAAAGPGVL